MSSVHIGQPGERLPGRMTASAISSTLTTSCERSGLETPWVKLGHLKFGDRSDHVLDRSRACNLSAMRGLRTCAGNQGLSCHFTEVADGERPWK